MATKKPTKKPAAKRTSRAKQSPKKTSMRSFRVVRQSTPFMSTKPTRQTLYWLIICAVVIVFTLWILKLQSDIQAIYDSIDADNANSVIVTPEKKKHH